MEHTVTYRPFQPEDAENLENIIRNTWQYDRFCSPKTARRLARLYLANCCASQTYTQVAVKHGAPIGVIMGRNKKERPSKRFALRRLWSILALLSNREGRAAAKAFSKVEGVDQTLLNEQKKDYQGELCFFVLSEDCRGAGVGKALFARLLDYMKSQGIEDFYLYTDTSCNYGFYEHQGMVRRGEITCSVPIGMDNSMTFFLYEYAPAH